MVRSQFQGQYRVGQVHKADSSFSFVITSDKSILPILASRDSLVYW